MRRIFEVSYNDHVTWAQISDLVGPKYGFWQSVRLGGTGSPKMLIEEASSAIQALLRTTAELEYSNIELRPRGIVVGFSNWFAIHAWVIPFEDLKLRYTEKEVHIESQDNYLLLSPAFNSRIKTSFCQRIIDIQASKLAL